MINITAKTIDEENDSLNTTKPFYSKSIPPCLVFYHNQNYLMADGASVAGVSLGTIALLISLICLVWIVLHIGQRKDWVGSKYYKDIDYFKGQ